MCRQASLYNTITYRRQFVVHSLQRHKKKASNSEIKMESIVKKNNEKEALITIKSIDKASRWET